MAGRFKIEHVAKVPRGWKVRTVTQGDHEVRIAFPAGPASKTGRKNGQTGSGHVVEILHPTHENPSLCPRRSQMQNPAELVLMGANPTIPETHQKKVKQTLRRMPRQVREVFDRNPGSRYAIKWHTGNISHAMQTKSEAESLLDQFHGAGQIIMVNPIPLRTHRNPTAELDAPEAEQAREVREGFTQQPVNSYTVLHEPHVPAGDYALIGPLVLLAVKPTQAGSRYPQVMEIEFKGHGVMAIASADRRQIYFVDGRQQLSADELRQFNSDAGNEVLLGECRQIVYLAKKYHAEVGNWARGKTVPYQHQFGEVSGVKPQLFYDTLNQRLILRGGNYRVEDAGIVD